MYILEIDGHIFSFHITGIHITQVCIYENLDILDVHVKSAHCPVDIWLSRYKDSFVIMKFYPLYLFSQIIEAVSKQSRSLTIKKEYVVLVGSFLVDNYF